MKPKDFRRQLRKEQTTAEIKFWNLVRNRKIENLKFRRQQTIGKYTVDFYCHEIKLIVEIYGAIHDNLGQNNYDDYRTKELESLGFKVFRIENDAICNFEEVVINELKAFISSIKQTLSAFQASLPKGENYTG